MQPREPGLDELLRSVMEEAFNAALFLEPSLIRAAQKLLTSAKRLEKLLNAKQVVETRDGRRVTVTGYDLLETMTLVAVAMDDRARLRVANAIAGGNEELARRISERMREYVEEILANDDPIAEHVSRRSGEDWYAGFAEFIQEPVYHRLFRQSLSRRTSRRTSSSSLSSPA